MTAAGVPADEGRQRRGLSDLLAEGDRIVGLTYWEDVLTFVLLAASQTAFALSIANADWVDEMPDLTVAAWAGMLVGVVLARLHTSAGWFAYDPARSALLSRVRWSAWWLFPAGLALGALASVAMVMHTMELADPLAMGVEARWSELWARLKDWGAALIFGGVSSDPMPFVLLMVFVTWIVPYLAGWAVFRWRNPWLALVPAGVGILTNISYLPGQPSIAFILFLFAAILLFTRLQLLRTIMRWQGQRAALPQLLSVEVLHAGAWVAVLLILMAWLVPTGRRARPRLGGVGASHAARDRPRRPLRPGLPRDRLEARQPHPPLRQRVAVAGPRQARGRPDVRGHAARGPGAAARRVPAPPLDGVRRVHARRLEALRGRT